MIPLLVDLPRGEFPYAPDQALEVLWHRLATPFVGWWCGRLIYVGESRKYVKRWSARPGSNRRPSAWEHSDSESPGTG